MMIPFGKVGKITEGDYSGWYASVQDDSSDTGGYYIFIFNDLNRQGKGYDYWVEEKEDLDIYFQDWKVEWELE
jgi:hypothetical protein